MKFKYLTGFTVMSMLAIIVALSATHGAVGVASCNYCQVKEIASTQSDSLDKIVVAEKAKAEMVIADKAIFINKTKTDKAIVDSFVEANNKVDDYAAIENKSIKTTDNKLIAAESAFSDSLFKRFDETKASYELAANSLINDGSAGLGSGKTSGHKQISSWQACNTASGTVAQSDQLICESCPRSERKAAAT